MTLLVGVLCSNGAVIAADRQLTHGAMGALTVGQAATKVHILDKKILFGSSGHVGLGQQLLACIQKKRKELETYAYHQLIVDIQKDMRTIVDPAWQTATKAAQIVGAQVALQDCVCHSLFAAHFKDGPRLVEITPQVSVECLSADSPFVALGSGKQVADPFLGFLRRIYWASRLPTVNEGALAAIWTIEHAIEMKVLGVGFGVDVFVLEPKDKGYTAKQLDEAELMEPHDFIRAAEDALRQVAHPAADGDIPPSQPPVMPPK
jgi:20S proteasome alpha/beta subunit